MLHAPKNNTFLFELVDDEHKRLFDFARDLSYDFFSEMLDNQVETLNSISSELQCYCPEKQVNLINRLTQPVESAWQYSAVRAMLVDNNLDDVLGALFNRYVSK